VGAGVIRVSFTDPGGTFRDHFSAAAPAYAAFRPRYPAALFTALARLAPGRALAWDCATGSGQAALGLAEHFERVLATDASASQIGAALPHPRVTYHQATADASGIATRSADLVTVAQALHWLDRDAFYREARRVLVPGGVVAVWCYALLEIEPAVNDVLDAFYRDAVGPYWPPERALTETGYRTIAFPFDEAPLPPLWMTAEWTLAELCGYVRTWSAVLRHDAATGRDAVAGLLGALEPLWGPADRTRTVRWPLAVRVGRV